MFQEDFTRGVLNLHNISKVLSNIWVTVNHHKLLQVCQRVTKGEPYDDLCQVCIEQFLKNKKIDSIPDNQRMYFFTKIVKNNYNSQSSPYYFQYKKFKFNEIENMDLEYLEYEEDDMNLDWVYKQLDELGWYYKRLMQLYVEEGASISKLSVRTTIPINSVSRDINKARKFLRDKRNKLRNGM